MHATTRMPIGAAFFVAGQQDVINIVKATRMPLVKWEKAKGTSAKVPEPPLMAAPPDVWRPVMANCQPALVTVEDDGESVLDGGA